MMSAFLLRVGGTERAFPDGRALLRDLDALPPESQAEVSLDGGPFVAAAAVIETLRARAAAPTADDVLEGFLRDVSTGPQPVVSAPPRPPLPPAVPPVEWPSLLPREDAPDPPAPPSPPRPAPGGSELSGAADPGAPALSAPSPPLSPTPKKVTRGAATQPTLAPTRSGSERVLTGGAVPDLDEWVEKLRRGEAETGLGRLGDGPTPALRGAGPDRSRSVLRVLGATLLGSAVVGTLWLWVRTGAQTAYPSEEALIRSSRRPANTVVEPEPVSTPGAPQSPERHAAAADRSLRNRVEPTTLPFDSDTQLEDILFRELSNLGLQPLRVRLESRQRVGAGPDREGRSVVADLDVLLAGIGGDVSAVAPLIRERFSLTLYVAGKYAGRTGIVWEQVTIAVPPPNPYGRTFDGRQLPSLWTGRLPIDGYFLTPSE